MFKGLRCHFVKSALWCYHLHTSPLKQCRVNPSSWSETIVCEEKHLNVSLFALQLSAHLNTKHVSSLKRWNRNILHWILTEQFLHFWVFLWWKWANSFQNLLNERQMLAHTFCTNALDFFPAPFCVLNIPRGYSKPCSTSINNQSSQDDQLPASAATLETPVCDLGCRDKWKRSARCETESPEWREPALVLGHPWLEVQMDVCETCGCRISQTFLYGGSCTTCWGSSCSDPNLQAAARWHDLKGIISCLSDTDSFNYCQSFSLWLKLYALLWL